MLFQRIRIEVFTCRYCPYYSTTLEPGDVLYNPPYWCHAIKNLTEKSVGVANRMMSGGMVGCDFTTPEEDYDIQRYKFNSATYCTSYTLISYIR